MPTHVGSITETPFFVRRARASSDLTPVIGPVLCVGDGP